MELQITGGVVSWWQTVGGGRGEVGGVMRVRAEVTHFAVIRTKGV